MRANFGLGAVVALLLGATSAYATTTTSNFQTRVVIAATCVISGATTLDFGTQGFLTGNVDQTTTFQVQCTNTTAFTIGLDNGQNYASSVRNMKGGPSNELIQYTLWQDTGHSTAWTNSGAGLESDTGTGSPVTYTVYGRIPSQTTPKPGTYTDTITVTVTY